MLFFYFIFFCLVLFCKGTAVEQAWVYYYEFSITKVASHQLSVRFVFLGETAVKKNNNTEWTLPAESVQCSSPAAGNRAAGRVSVHLHLAPAVTLTGKSWCFGCCWLVITGRQKEVWLPADRRRKNPPAGAFTLLNVTLGSMETITCLSFSY